MLISPTNTVTDPPEIVFYLTASALHFETLIDTSTTRPPYLRLREHHGKGAERLWEPEDNCSETVSSTGDKEILHSCLNKTCAMTTQVDMPACMGESHKAPTLDEES